MLNDQVVVVTGASRGLGAGFAKRLSADGANVVLAARNADLLRQVADDIQADGGTALPVQCDVPCRRTSMSSSERRSTGSGASTCS